MSAYSSRQYGMPGGGAEMRKSTSTDTTKSYNSKMSSFENHSAASPWTAPSSSYDGASPDPETSYNDAYDFQTSDASYYPRHLLMDHHLTLSNPNDILPSNAWSTQTQSSGQPFYDSFLGNDQQLSLDVEQYSRSTHSKPAQSKHRTWPTPGSLGWLMNDPQIKEKYTFCVNKGMNPYFELRKYESITILTPERVYLDDHSDAQQKIFPCTFPSDNKRCYNKTGERIFFARPADLERHYRHVHTPVEQLEIFVCGYAGCDRKSGRPFTRKDHFRDHLRDYHKEDLGSPKRKKGENFTDEMQRAWEDERKINSRNWRCVRCLHNNRVIKGWNCAECKATCEAWRQQTRRDIAAKEAAAEAVNNFLCETCHGALCVEFIPGTFDECPACLPTNFASYGDFDTQMYGATEY